MNRADQPEATLSAEDPVAERRENEEAVLKLGQLERRKRDYIAYPSHLGRVEPIRLASWGQKIKRQSTLICKTRFSFIVRVKKG